MTKGQIIVYVHSDMTVGKTERFIELMRDENYALDSMKPIEVDASKAIQLVFTHAREKADG